MKFLIFFIFFISNYVYAKSPFLIDCEISFGQLNSKPPCNYLYEEDSINYDIEVINEKLEGIGSINLVTGDYRGSVIDKKFFGYGKFSSQENNFFLGEYESYLKRGISNFEDFILSADGFILDAKSGAGMKDDSIIYIGAFKNGEYHGEGIYFQLKDNEDTKKNSFSLGVYEEGELIINYKKDIEKCEFDDADKIINDFCYKGLSYDDLNIYGVYKNGNLKLGFQDFKAEGYGGLVIGYFKDDTLHGYGFESYNLEHSDYYFGEFKDGLRDGYGVEITPTSKHYGEFKFDIRNGFAYNEFKNQKILGIWRDNLANGYIEIEHPNGKFTASNFKNNVRDGLGYVTVENESYYGEFKNDKFDGYGIYTINKVVEKGIFKENNFIEKLDFCKKTNEKYYAAKKCENNEDVSIYEFLYNKNQGFGDRWLEEYYKKAKKNPLKQL